MPRNLRNFWIELDVDGYLHTVARGPRKRSEGFSITINIASHREPHRLMRISGFALQNGRNRVIVDVDRKLTSGEHALNSLMDSDNPHSEFIIEEKRDCDCGGELGCCKTQNL